MPLSSIECTKPDYSHDFNETVIFYCLSMNSLTHEWERGSSPAGSWFPLALNLFQGEGVKGVRVYKNQICFITRRMISTARSMSVRVTSRCVTARMVSDEKAFTASPSALNL